MRSTRRCYLSEDGRDALAERGGGDRLVQYLADAHAVGLLGGLFGGVAGEQHDRSEAEREGARGELEAQPVRHAQNGHEKIEAVGSATRASNAPFGVWWLVTW